MCAVSTINSLTVETPEGYKDFALLCGDATYVQADLLVFSSHAGVGEIQGRVYNALRARFGGISLETQRLVLSLAQGSCFELDATHPGKPDFVVPAGTYLLAATEGMPFRDLLIVRIPSPSYFPTPDAALRAYNRCVECVFSSIAALEFAGHHYRTIAMPVLAGGRSYPKKQTMGVILTNALKWLKYSRHTYRFLFTVHDEQEVGTWNQAMNDTLGRTFDDGSYSSSIKELRKRLNERTATISTVASERRLTAVLDHVREALCSPRDVSIQQFGVLGRQLAEAVSGAVCDELNLPRSNNAFANIEKIGESGRVSSWIHSYLHCLRVLGNESAHLLTSAE
jgi:hypothetical protein